MVVAPSVLGQATILPNHAPLLADLGFGVVELRAANRADQFFVAGGSLEVERDQVVVLAETAEGVDAIDTDAPSPWRWWCWAGTATPWCGSRVSPGGGTRRGGAGGQRL
jgi:hypothetical protein